MKLKEYMWSRHAYLGHKMKCTVVLCEKCKKNYLKELADKKSKGKCYLCS